MIRALIVDDERHARQALEHKLRSYCAEIGETICADSAASAAAIIRAQAPDLVFLDVAMPNGSGFDLLDTLGEEQSGTFEVIFVTAFEQHAIAAIKHAAIDYLLKPVQALELQAAVRKALRRRQERLGSAERPARLVINGEAGIDYVPMQEIIRCRAESNYTRIYLTDGRELITARTLGEVESQLDPGQFFRVHHSHLISQVHIRRYLKGRGGAVELSDGSEITVSTRRRETFLLWMEGKR